jgi:hypothetical protein
VETDKRLTEKFGMHNTFEREKSSENLTMPENLAIYYY